MSFHHHEVLTWTVVCSNSKQPTKTVKYRFDKADYDKMRSSFAAIDWNTELSNLSLEDTWNFVKYSIREAIRRFVPRTRPGMAKKPGSGRPPWMTAEVRLAVNSKSKAFQKYKKSREGKDYDCYIMARNKAKAEVRAAVKNYEKSIADGSKHNSKLFYNYVNSKVKGNTTFPDIINASGVNISDNVDKANEFNNFFCSVFTDENPESELADNERRGTAELVDIEFSCEDVGRILMNLKPDKSSGPDEVHPKVLKECAAELTYPLYVLFERSMQTGRVPAEWKIANVTPIHKKGIKSDVNNYRPISLTSTICKVMERIVRKNILNHMLDNNLISKVQHGFLPGRSCSTQLLEMLDKCTEILDKGGSVDIIYLDLAKAFDTVPHRRLLMKLRSYGVGGRVVDWLGDFLIGRQQRVMVNGDGSRWSPVTSGVPQGSVLGPILFVCYINDMPEVVKALLYLYADDAKLMREVNEDTEVRYLQEDMGELQLWTDESLLRYNSAKCKVLHLGSRNMRGRYFVNVKEEAQELTPSDLEKDLGVWVDEGLKFDKHINKTVTRANQILGLINRTFSYKDINVIKKLYTSLVRPHLEYCNVVWSPRYKKDVQIIETVQKRATRMIRDIRDLPHEERLKRMQLPSMVYRRYRGDMIEVYKYLTGRNYMSREDFIPLAEDNTRRGHSRKLLKRYCRTGLRQHFFSYRVVNGWNILPEDVVMAPTTNTFKNRIARVWRESCYITDPDVFGRRTEMISPRAGTA